ncbi:alpha/beta hydrolase [Nocardioides albidus]|uniref:Alpha/beta hydrolase n=1 Tax=Nocardioides albidus TaxID=1517589 RepID=A0A5C4WF87_9ACTN|nr:alpha/beta hydrolase [Nocardioides albidus]TNM46075.1 alpha/beta hydrolase [Nocardioides albidus]
MDTALRWFLAVALLMTAGCGTSSTPRAGTPTPTTTASTEPEYTYGRLQLESGEIRYWCAGEGEPAILLEAGTDAPGTTSFGRPFTLPLAARTTVCTYDRPGTGSSSRAPERRRGLEDLCVVQDQVIAALGLSPPYVLAGQSGGGNLSIGCAARHPERTAALVTIDSYHDDPAQMRAWQREGEFDWRENPEHVDYVRGYTDVLDRLPMPIGTFPVLVFSATRADPGGVENQRFWLGLSPSSTQVVVEGGHNLHQQHPEQLAERILGLLAELRS